MNEESRRRPPRTLLNTLLRPIAWLLFHTIYPVRVVNRRGISEKKAPYLLIANHNSNLDAVLLGWLCPYEMRGLAKRELIRGPISKWFYEDKLHFIPISRNEFDIQAMRASMKALKDGHVLCVFPEGTRGLKQLMEKVEKGVALLAMRQKVEMLPVYIDGRFRPFRLTRAIVGEPMRVGDYPQGVFSDAKADELCEGIRAAFYGLRDRLRATEPLY